MMMTLTMMMMMVMTMMMMRMIVIIIIIIIIIIITIRIVGMWTGYTCGRFMEAIVGCIILVTTDWENQVQRVS